MSKSIIQFLELSNNVVYGAILPAITGATTLGVSGGFNKIVKGEFKPSYSDALYMSAITGVLGLPYMNSKENNPPKKKTIKEKAKNV